MRATSAVAELLVNLCSVKYENFRGLVRWAVCRSVWREQLLASFVRPRPKNINHKVNHKRHINVARRCKMVWPEAVAVGYL